MSSSSESRRKVFKPVVKFPVEDPRQIRSAGFCFVEKEDVLDQMLDDDAICRTRVMRADLTAADNEYKMKCTNYSRRLETDSLRLTKNCRAIEAPQIDQTKKASIYSRDKTNQQPKESKYITLMEGITKSMDLLDSIDKNMSLMEETKRNKCRRQFEEWNMQVHGSIQVNKSRPDIQRNIVPNYT